MIVIKEKKYLAFRKYSAHYSRGDGTTNVINTK